jgi:hypothetical protein
MFIQEPAMMLTLLLRRKTAMPEHAAEQFGILCTSQLPAMASPFAEADNKAMS